LHAISQFRYNTRGIAVVPVAFLISATCRFEVSLMKICFGLPLALLLSTGAPLRAEFVSWSFTARVQVFDDAGNRAPGLHGGTLLNGHITFDNSVPGTGVALPNNGQAYPGPGAAITFDVNGVHLGNGAAPISLTVLRMPASPFSPKTLFSFAMQANSLTTIPSLSVGFGMFKQVEPQTKLDYSLKDLRLDFNHFDGGFLFYNYSARGLGFLIGSPDQLLIEAQVVAITPDTTTRDTPEPPTWVLCGLGSVGLAGVGWRRRSGACAI
jgi:hypothetical protein